MEDNLQVLRCLLIREQRWLHESDPDDDDRKDNIRALEWAVAAITEMSSAKRAVPLSNLAP